MHYRAEACECFHWVLFLMIQSRCLHVSVFILEEEKEKNFIERCKAVHQRVTTAVHWNVGQIIGNYIAATDE